MLVDSLNLHVKWIREALEDQVLPSTWPWNLAHLASQPKERSVHEGVCVIIYIYMCLYVYMHIYIYVCVCMHIDVYVYRCIRAHVYICIHAYCAHDYFFM